MKEKDLHLLKVTVLGSGTCVPAVRRYPASYFFFLFGERENWLVDIGEGALLRLSEAGESYREIDRIFISHTHPDHIGALVPLLLALKYTPGFKREKPLFIYGPDDVGEYLQMNFTFAPYLKSDFPMEFISLSSGSEIELNNCLLETRKMKHSGSTLGYRWDFNGCLVVYGADGGVSEELIQLADNADLLILESSFPKSRPSPIHLTTFEAGKIAKEAAARKLMLTHFYPEVASMEDEDKEKEVRKSGYEGEIIFAKDLLSFEI